MRKRKAATTTPKTVELIDVPRRWWQMKQVRLRCACGWESEQTWPAKPMVEVAYTLRWTMRVFAEQHWDSEDHEIRRQP